MTTMYVAAGDAVALVARRNGAWEATLRLEELPAQCLAADPLQPERVYCGTFGRGLWRSDDAGHSWQPAGHDQAGGIPHAEVMSVAVGRAERSGGYGVVWAGTEPSAIFRSDDGGTTWREQAALRALPSAPTWSFPPRPWTSHVRCLVGDPLAAGRLIAGIEAGGVMRSLDGGETWEDSKPGAQRDAHTLATHPGAPGRVYEASGAGFTETRDGGTTWQRADDGLAWRYLWGLAADPADPETLVVSASPSARHAHFPGNPEATLYRKTAGAPWQEVRSGLPQPQGTLAYLVATTEAEPHVFYAAPHQGDLYRSADAGLTWEPLHVRWPNSYQPADVTALVVVDGI